MGFRRSIEREGFAFVPAAELRPLLGAPQALSDWSRFAASWDHLQLDTHLPEGHRYRRRRHATLSARAGEPGIRVEPHQAHYQSLDYNRLVGGIERWFEPMEPAVLERPTFRAVLDFCLQLFGRFPPAPACHSNSTRSASRSRPGRTCAPTPQDV